MASLLEHIDKFTGLTTLVAFVTIDDGICACRFYAALELFPIVSSSYSIKSLLRLAALMIEKNNHYTGTASLELLTIVDSYEDRGLVKARRVIVH